MFSRRSRFLGCSNISLFNRGSKATVVWIVYRAHQFGGVTYTIARNQLRASRARFTTGSKSRAFLRLGRAVRASSVDFAPSDVRVFARVHTSMRTVTYVYFEATIGCNVCWLHTASRFVLFKSATRVHFILESIAGVWVIWSVFGVCSVLVRIGSSAFIVFMICQQFGYTTSRYSS